MEPCRLLNFTEKDDECGKLVIVECKMNIFVIIMTFFKADLR